MSEKNSNKPKNEKLIKDIIKTRTLHESVLKEADQYIGSVQLDKIPLYIYDNETDKIVYKKECNVVMGLYKIFDEILVNATDNTVRDKNCNLIKVTIDKETGIIEVENNGITIPVGKHEDTDTYAPDIIFGTLLSSGNYDKKNKITGGKNGIGANCANIYSKWFEINIVDAERNLKYYQKFSNNMYDKTVPVVEKISKTIKDGKTCIKFLPDYDRFELPEGLNDDMYSLLKKRVYDVAGTTTENVKVYYNNELINVKSFREYIELYFDDTKKLIYNVYNDRWSVGTMYDPTSSFRHMSFVNHIATFKGGTHLNYVVDQITDKVRTEVLKKNKDLTIKDSQIKDNLIVFVNSTIEDPKFNSQTKEELAKKKSDFGSKCEIDDDFIKKLCASGLSDKLTNIAQSNQEKIVDKALTANAKNSIEHPKLADAKFAGTKNGYKCTLFLTEGDSALAFAKNGLNVLGREYYGAFPLKGKLLNVREATDAQLLKNEEIINLINIIGINKNTVYEDTKKLRYGKITILTDQDLDGMHIKGLIMNFLHFFCPSLLKIDGFLQTFNTPIVKISKKTDVRKKEAISFFSEKDYFIWENANKNVLDKYNIKYYKGLATSTPVEAKELFEDYDKKYVEYTWGEINKNNGKVAGENDNDNGNSNDNNSKTNNDNNSKDDNDDNNSNNANDNNVNENENDNDNISKNSSITSNVKNDKKTKKGGSIKTEKKEKIKKTKNSIKSKVGNDKSDDAIVLAFDKNHANNRKTWIKNYDLNQYIKSDERQITYHDYINKELILFSMYDNIRSIPCINDGLKPSQRKILYGAFKRKLSSEIKVAQLAGYISEHSGYHHGEASLNSTIVGMAQDYCGSNNIALFSPIGEFGTRLDNGKDAGSPRYIYTALQNITKKLFIEDDENVIDIQYEENMQIEPKTYYPILPLILMNGTEGIGTGYSTNIPQFNPIDVANNLKLYINGTNVKDLPEVSPWCCGFIGNIVKNNGQKYTCYGIYKIISENTVEISELPIGKGLVEYKDFLAKNKAGLHIEEIEEISSTERVHIVITFENNILQKMLKEDEDKKDYIYTLLKLTSSINLTNMNLFVNGTNEPVKFNSANEIIEKFAIDRLDIYVKRKNYMTRVFENKLQLLIYKRKFMKEVDDDKIKFGKNIAKSKIIEILEEKKYPKLSTKIDEDATPSYDYLTEIKIFDFTKEHIDKLDEEINKRTDSFNIYKNKTCIDLWKEEIDDFLHEYDVYMKDWNFSHNTENNNNINDKKNNKNNKNNKKTKTTKDEVKKDEVKTTKSKDKTKTNETKTVETKTDKTKTVEIKTDETNKDKDKDKDKDKIKTTKSKDKPKLIETENVKIKTTKSKDDLTKDVKNDKKKTKTSK